MANKALIKVGGDAEDNVMPYKVGTCDTMYDAPGTLCCDRQLYDNGFNSQGNRDWRE